MSLVLQTEHRWGEAFTLTINTTLKAGITVLFGASGSGKTATLDLVAGFLRPQRGRVELDGAVLTDTATRRFVPPQQRSIGYVLQDRALFPHLTLRENVAFGTRDDAVVESLLRRFGLAELGGRLPRQVSGGQRQRCAIARALARQPRLLLLDEPAQGLDAPLREDLLSLLRDLRERDRLPMLLVTHQFPEALAVADEVLVYEAGQVVQQAPPGAVAEQPASAAVARLSGLYAEVPVRVIGWRDGQALVEWQGQCWPVASAEAPLGPASFCYRPEAARLGAGGVRTAVRELRLVPGGWLVVGEGGWQAFSPAPVRGELALCVDRALLFAAA